jgi:hypothetical protein
MDVIGADKMKIGLIDVDGHHFPNLALMKLSAWHKARGDTVEWWWSDLFHYDIVYMAKVFSDTYTQDHPEPMNTERVIKGGTGYAITLENGREVYNPERDKPLAPEIEHIYPDYSIYPDLTANTAYGFLTRGCPRGCHFCHVAGKEGRTSIKVADLSEFWRGQRNINLMDPNILACPDRWGLLEQLVASRAYVDFNQGLDIRLMDKNVADLLGKMRIERLHFAWDNPAEDLRPHFERFSKWYRRKDPSKKGVYVLTNFNSTLEEDLGRIYALRDMGYSPYVMIYNKDQAPKEVRYLQRWCNNRLIFKAQPDFRKYDPKRG